MFFPFAVKPSLSFLIPVQLDFWSKWDILLYVILLDLIHNFSLLRTQPVYLHLGIDEYDGTTILRSAKAFTKLINQHPLVLYSQLSNSVYTHKDFMRILAKCLT